MAGAQAGPSVREFGDITILGVRLTPGMRMRAFPIVVALLCGLVSRSLWSLFPAPSVLPVMWVLGALLSAFILGGSDFW